MTAIELYHEAARRGLRLEPRGDKLAVTPRDRVPPEFADVLRQHKAELLGWLSRPPCPGWRAVPPDNLPLNSAMPHPTPDDRERVINYIFRQGDSRPCPLYAWVVRRESAYYDGPGRHWDCALHAYAAARDAACWQFGCDEAEMLERLAGFDEASQQRQTKENERTA